MQGHAGDYALFYSYKDLITFDICSPSLHVVIKYAIAAYNVTKKTGD